MKPSIALYTAVLFVLLLASQAWSQSTEMPNEGQIMSILTAANKGEIAAGKVAEKKAQDSKVKKFAKEMVTEHTKNQTQGDSLAKKLAVKPMPAEKATTLEKDAQDKMTTLNSKTGKEFDRAYIDSQVEMHTMVLSDLETNLIPAAQKQELKTFLMTTRDHVKMHLETAKNLQASMK